MRAYYCATLHITLHPTTSATKETYRIWRGRNPRLLLNLTTVTLANQRRYITNKTRQTGAEIDTIKEQVQQEISRDGEKMPVTENRQISNISEENLIGPQYPAIMRTETPEALPPENPTEMKDEIMTQ